MTLGSPAPSPRHHPGLVVGLPRRGQPGTVAHGDPHDADARTGASTDAVLTGLERFCARTGRDVATTAVSIAVGDAAQAVPAARARGHATVLAVEAPDDDVFALADGDDFAEAIERFDPALTSARVAWHPADHPDRKKQQALGLTRLGAWLHEIDRRLLVEVVVRPTEEDLVAVDGDRARFASERRPSLTVEAVREIRDLGTEPDLWAVEPPGDEEQTLLELVRDAGRDQVGLLVAVAQDDAPDGTRDLTRGVLIDHAAWAPAVRVAPDRAERAGTGEDAAETVAVALERLVPPAVGPG